jgi:predicted ATPase
MDLHIKRFCIYGLHNKYDIEIPISDNKLILVGVNGLGKTTVVSILYFLLTEQWSRLLEYEFKNILIEVNENVISISRTDIEDIYANRELLDKNWKISSNMSPKAIKLLTSHPYFPKLISKNELNPNILDVVSRDIGLNSNTVRRILLSIIDDSSNLFEYPKSIKKFLKELKTTSEYQVLYLPTYRRIEQDLKAIFPEVDERQIRELTSRNSMVGLRNKSHVELIQFGMDDVEGKIDDELREISQSARTQLSNLTASYLRDIIRNNANSFDPMLINSLDAKKIRDVLSRVEENTLGNKDKLELESAIARIRDNSNKVSERDMYLAHFFSRLLTIYNNLSENERKIQKLAEICNKYLEGKTLRYNDNDYTAKIFDLQDSPIDWKLLSSGEKQVASLFTHLFLSKEKSQFIVIDEPELSLSVSWQKTLLPDIVNSGSCSFLVAVTHSPFIFANELDKYAIDLAKCIKPTLQNKV